MSDDREVTPTELFGAKVTSYDHSSGTIYLKKENQNYEVFVDVCDCLTVERFEDCLNPVFNHDYCITCGKPVAIHKRVLL